MYFLKTKLVPEFSRKGQVIAERAAHAIIANEFPRVYAMKDMAARNKTLQAMHDTLRERGFYLETMYDAAHGRRYMVLIFRLSMDKDPDRMQSENRGARKMGFDFITAPENSFYNSLEA